MQPGDLSGYDLLAEAMRQRPAWHAEAACTGLPGEWWFPAWRASGGRPRLASARRCDKPPPDSQIALTLDLGRTPRLR